MARIWRVPARGWRLLSVAAAALAAAGVLGAVPPAVASVSPQALDWTKQAPAASPPRLAYPAMAYDAATGTVVMFGGETPGGHWVNQTWTWDGTTWTKQAPATSPPGFLDGGSMAYDAATGTVVLFGGLGRCCHTYGETWIWNGTTWTRQHPAASPTARGTQAMAYDAATGTVVLFGGLGHNGLLGDTWTWNGTTWTKQAPAAHPSARVGPAMAYDHATGNSVLFGGLTGHGTVIRYLHDTWTWG